MNGPTIDELKPLLFDRLGAILPAMQFVRAGDAWHSPYKLDGTRPRVPRKDKTVSTRKTMNLFEQGGASKSYFDAIAEAHGTAGDNAATFQRMKELAGVAGRASRMPVERRKATTPPNPFPPLSNAARAQLAARAREWIGAGDGAADCDFWDASTVRFENRPGPLDAVALLENLFAPDEWIFMGDKAAPAVPGVTVRPCADWLEWLRKGRPWRWEQMTLNPLTGQDGRTREQLAHYRFLLAEMDGVPMEAQLAFWWAAPLPLAALVHSGRKSLHAWLRFDADTPAEAEQIDKAVFPRLCAMGCDAEARPNGGARLTRCPGAVRADTGEIQRLLYLDPLPPADGRGRRGVRSPIGKPMACGAYVH